MFETLVPGVPVVVFNRPGGLIESCSRLSLLVCCGDVQVGEAS